MSLKRISQVTLNNGLQAIDLPIPMEVEVASYEKRVFRLLREIKSLAPHLRVAQIIEGALTATCPNLLSNFYAEDEQLATALQNYLDAIVKEQVATEDHDLPTAIEEILNASVDDLL